MPALTLTSRQLATLLHVSGLRPGPGSPLHTMEPMLPRDDPEYSALLEMAVLRPADDGERPNRAVTSALRACAEPDEVLWVATPVAGGVVTVCRRGALFVDCSQLPDRRASIVFPLDRAQVLLVLTAALSADRPEPEPGGFALRGPLVDLYLLRLIGDLGGSAEVERCHLSEALVAAMEDPERTIPVVSHGRAVELTRLTADPAALDAAMARLVAQGHLVQSPNGVRIAGPTAAFLGRPVDASFDVGRRTVTDGADGTRQLAERAMRVERRGDRLFVLRVVPVDGEPHVELIEHTRAAIRSLVGVFLLGDLWTRVAG